MSQLLLIGTGLIGGSFALAARHAGIIDRVVGVDVDPGRLSQAIELGIIDQGEKPGSEAMLAALAQSNLVCVAVPGSVAPEIIAGLFSAPAKEQPKSDCIVFDVGSVKGPVIEGVRESLGYLPGNYVPLHPIAGSEQHGPVAARADLFAAHKVIITPENETKSWAIEEMRSIWTHCGARVSELASVRHDEILAATSHMPHLMAFALMSWLDQQHTDEALEYAGGGIRDFSRIAESDAKIWASIFADNAHNLVPQIDELLAVVQDFKHMIDNAADSSASHDLQSQLHGARLTRLRLLKKMGLD